MSEEQNGVGKADSQFVELGERSSLVLVIGREIFDQTGGAADQEVTDFTIVGEVTSAADVAKDRTCTSQRSGGTGAFSVSVSQDGVGYRFAGLWTPQHNEFDLGCAELKSARYVRVDAQEGATGRLDAIEASSCLDQSVTSAP